MAVHGPTAAESNEHRFGSAGDAEHFMAENQRIGLLKGLKRPVAVFNHLADECLANAVGCSTDFRALWHAVDSFKTVIKTCFG